MPVNIHGKEYYTVVERLAMLKEEHKQNYSLITKIEVCDSEKVIVKAKLTIDGYEFTGLAEEIRNSNNINKTSALENCETSAIGRALSSAGYFGTEFCSANELENALDQQGKPKKKAKVVKFDDKKENPFTGEPKGTKPASPKQKQYIISLTKQKGKDESEYVFADMSSKQASDAIENLMKLKDAKPKRQPGGISDSDMNRQQEKQDNEFDGYIPQ